MLERYVRTAVQQVLRIGLPLPRIAQYITTFFVLAFVFSRLWASWKIPSWTSWLQPDRRQNWSGEDYPALKHPARQIRLLNLFPAMMNEEIEASLYTVSFLDLPVYEAVSYTWGDPNNTRTMTLNGKRFRITENLWASLAAMRLRSANRTVWVDAICINQADLEEKSYQVGLMAYIYERAARVLIWLAESPHPDWVADAWRFRWDPVWATQEASKDWPATAHWLHRLIDQEYWKRCWIIQEIRQAREIHIYFGSHREHGWMPWSTFIKLGELYRNREIVFLKIDRIFALQRLRYAKYIRGSSLDELLQQLGDCFCSAQLDRIYAFLGIADDDPGRYFLPDYERSAFQLYTDLLIFYEGSEFHQARREIEIVHFAALVRATLSRKPSSSPGIRKVAKFGVDPGSWSYQFSRKFSGSFSRQTMESLAALLDLVSEFLYPDWGYAVSEEATWLPQDPESSRDWLPFFEKGLSRPVLARGALAGHILKMGPTYGSYLADPGCVNRWIRDTVEAVSSNTTLLQQVIALNKKLVTILGDTGDYKIRNFVCFTDRGTNSYQQSRIFLGADLSENLIMGLVPNGTPEGAQLIQFWNSDASLVVMPQQGKNESVVPKTIIGRAGVVRYGDEAETVGWDKPQGLDPFLSGSRLSVQVPMSIDILTKLSFDTVVLPSTFGDYWPVSFSPDHWTFDY